MIEPFDEGWDNTVHLADGRLALRFPRHAAAAARVRRELAVLPRIAPLLPLAVPVPHLVGAPSPTFPWPYWAAPLLPGRELAEAGVVRDRSNVAAAVGTFLRRLHDPALAAVVPDLPVDPMGRADLDRRLPATREWLARLDASAGPAAGSYDAAAVQHLLRSADGVRLDSCDTVLVHGDLHVRHVLVGARGGVTGVIDWGDVCRADPVVDLAIAYAAFSGPSRAALFDAYGRAPDPARAVVGRVLAVFLSAALTVYAQAQDRSSLLAEAIAGINRAVGD